MITSHQLPAWIAPILAVALVAGMSACSNDANWDGNAQIDEATLAPNDLVFRYVNLGETSKLDSLLKANPDLLNIYEDTYYNTPLHVAALVGNRRVVNVLLDNGANPNVENINGEIPAETALQEAHVDLSKYLHEVAANAR